MTGRAISLFGSVANRLGESPVWDADQGWLWWVDIGSNAVLAADVDGVLQREWHFAQPVGSIGLADGGLVAALADGFALIGTDGALCPLACPAIGEGAIRFNDGKADRQGRFLAGTMQHGGQAAALGTLWRLDHDGSAVRLLGDFRLANATCFSPAGEWLYFADSMDGIVRRYGYDPATGRLGPREDFFDGAAHGLTPDGATVDAEGRLWVAMVLADQIACIAPDGALVELIDLPLPYPSCPAFGGSDMATLYVTTIADSGHRLRSDHPQAGRMLAISGWGARGLPEARFTAYNHT